MEGLKTDTAGYLFSCTLHEGCFYFILFVKNITKGDIKMKNTVKITVSLILALMIILFAVSCGGEAEEQLWEIATYTSDTTLGEGENTVTVELTAKERTIVFTIKTDKATLGEALYELQLINDPSFYNVCNGMTADWDKYKSYWAFYVGDETAPALYGIGDAKAVTVGEPTYRIVYTIFS